ncbi:hypothetical protein TA3x_002333 [Tundrisphaera sp. TA3]|uniref:hypothetical protein n=1 Tax=Tundrisphaera sp. TA3 TaxID=3435775 RepID=UPI003EB85166
MNENQPPQSTPGGGGKPAPISRSEAIRRALAAGFEGADEGTAYLRREFGIEMSTSLFLAAKATERKKGWAKGGKPGRKAKQAADAGPAPGGIDFNFEDEDDPDG